MAKPFLIPHPQRRVLHSVRGWASESIKDKFLVHLQRSDWYVLRESPKNMYVIHASDLEALEKIIYELGENKAFSHLRSVGLIKRLSYDYDTQVQRTLEAALVSVVVYLEGQHPRFKDKLVLDFLHTLTTDEKDKLRIARVVTREVDNSGWKPESKASLKRKAADHEKEGKDADDWSPTL